MFPDTLRAPQGGNHISKDWGGRAWIKLVRVFRPGPRGFITQALVLRNILPNFASQTLKPQLLSIGRDSGGESPVTPSPALGRRVRGALAPPEAGCRCVFPTAVAAHPPNPRACSWLRVPDMYVCMCLCMCVCLLSTFLPTYLPPSPPLHLFACLPHGPCDKIHVPPE
jgi:hypothetical protein